MEIYTSYTRADEKYGKELKKRLLPTQSFGYTVWSKEDIAGGAKWLEEMKKHLANAWLFMPLVSADWLADDMCQKEFQGALYLLQEPGCKIRIIPIYLRECLWEYSELQHFSMLPDNGKQITAWNNKDKAWKSVQKSLLKIIQSRMIF